MDGALYEGYEVQQFYESMMAKVIVRGKDRESAIQNLKQALDEYVIDGLVTNIPLVQRVLDSRSFANAEYDNGSLERMLDGSDAAAGNELIAALAVAMVMNQDQAKKTMPSRWKMHGRRTLMVNRLSSGTA